MLRYKQTEDWSVTFRSAGDMAFMFHTVLADWSYDAEDVGICHIVSLLTTEGGGTEFNNGMPEFYRMPSTARIPLRDGDDGVTLTIVMSWVSENDDVVPVNVDTLRELWIVYRSWSLGAQKPSRGL